MLGDGDVSPLAVIPASQALSRSLRYRLGKPLIDGKDQIRIGRTVSDTDGERAVGGKGFEDELVTRRLSSKVLTHPFGIIFI